jgi:flagellar basal body P-ring protein FlgI
MIVRRRFVRYVMFAGPCWFRLTVVMLLAGCEGMIWETESPRKPQTEAPRVVPEIASSAAYQNTIGAVAYFDGLTPLQVRGYGLVVGLGRNGSRECPRPVRQKLVEQLEKQYGRVGGRVGTRQLTPEKLIDDPDTAVVLVQGGVPAGAAPGTRFDVTVTALPGTQTRSLRGGRLYTAELETFRETSSGTSVSGQVVARAAGPVFINPFAGPDSATQADLLQGTVIGGGWAVEERNLRLILLQPSYAVARMVRDRLNDQFSTGPRVADAVSPSLIEIHPPKEFHDDLGHFMTLVRALYLTTDPSFTAVRARQLADEITRPTAPHPLIAACFEGMGPSILPMLTELYAHPQEYISFFASAAGIRLGDHIAADALALHARNPRSPHRYQAIRALGAAKGMANAAGALRGLLQDSDPRARIAAFEALVSRKDASVRSTLVAEDAFFVDEIDANGPALVYVKRARERRIALFGRDLRVFPPVYYRAPDGGFTINANPEDDMLTLFRVVPTSQRLSPPVYVSPELPNLVRFMGGDPDLDDDGRLEGMGLDYGAVAGALQHFCGQDAIQAKFVFEEPNAAELFGPGSPGGRPESELGTKPPEPVTGTR